MRKLKVEDEFAEVRAQEKELIIRNALAETSLKFLEQSHGKEQEVNEHLKNLSAKLRTDLSIFQKDFEDFNKASKQSLSRYQDIYLALLDEQRRALRELNRKEEYDEELIRKYLSLVDLEETKLRGVSFSQ
ncbi:MAG: hypothetical protein WD824_13115 [Cyclobacteriaceae bacterium]